MSNQVRKISSIIFTVAISAAVLLTAVLTFTVGSRASVSVYENRTLSTFPELTAASAADGSLTDELEQYFCDHGVFRSDVLTLLTWLDMDIFKRPVVNEIYITDDDTLLPFYDFGTSNASEAESDAREMADRLVLLNDAVSSYGGDFMYVAVPSQAWCFGDEYPSYLYNPTDNINISRKTLFSALDSAGVSYTDIGDSWDSSEYNLYMSSVDHHFTYDGFMSVYSIVMNNLNDRFGLGLGVLSDEDMTRVTLPQQYLGSRARKLWGLWSSSEQLSYGEINSPVAYTRYDWGSTVPSDTPLIKLPDAGAEYSEYSMFMSGDYSETVIDTDRKDLPSLLIFGDSFTNPLEGLMYWSFDEQRSLDLRYYSDMTLLEYINTWKPDVVILVRDYSSMTDLTGNGDIK